MIIAKPGRPPTFCIGGIAESLPPQCSGVPTAGVDPMTLPGAQGSPPGTVWTSAVTLIGTWDGTTFTVVRRDDAPPPASTTTTTKPPRCDAPPETRLGYPMFAGQIQQALQPYLDAHGDTVGESWWDDANQTLILGFSDAPENHLAEVRSISARTCVVQVAHSTSEVQAYQDRVVRSAADHHIHLYSVSANPQSLTINLVVAVHDAAMEAWIRENFAGHILVKPALVPLDG